MDSLGKKEIQELSDKFETRTIEELLAWAVQRFVPRIALASSFGPEDVALIDMLYKIHPGFKVITLDTGYLFDETLGLMDRLQDKYRINLEVCRPLLSKEEMERQYGPRLYARDPTLCCRIRKVDPLRKALSDLDAWITGIRRDQTPTRAECKKIEFDAIFNLVKLNPLADWSQERVWDYVRANKIPYNPLHDAGYPSIGCEPCTRPLQPDEEQRSGRWSGKEKTECGLHLEKA